MLMKDNGGTLANLPNVTCSGIGSNSCTYQFMLNWLPYVNTLKNCNSQTISGNCWHPSGTVKKLYGGTSGSLINAAAFVLTNGSLVAFDVGTANCSFDSLYGPSKICARMYVDVNGFKGSNVLGKDIYYADATRNGMSPGGALTPNPSFGCNSTTNYGNEGFSCASLVLKNIDY